MEYRTATTMDLDELASLRWSFRLEESPGTPLHDWATFQHACITFLRQGLADRTWTYWIATEPTQIVAHIFIQRIAKIPKPNRLRNAFGFVTNVYTRPTYRNRGIGTQLMTHVIAWARQQDLENLVVWPSERSVPFYQRAGFQGDSTALELELQPYVL
jgi:GNAT superfamily N-acetyltransferase